ncbi:MAG: T9SS type A sorting domain-containing protein [Bacteroidales bacterium]
MKKSLLLILFLLPLFLLGQNEKWEKKYFEGIHTLSRDITESYDNGFLLSSSYDLNPRTGMIFKLDINGEPLWNKRLVFGALSNVLVSHANDKDGNIYLAGGVINSENNQSDYYQYDPYIVKVNACGEFEWGKIFYSPIANMSRADQIQVMSNGNILIGMMYDVIEQKNIALYCMSPKGDILWKNYYDFEDKAINSEAIFDLKIISGDNALITGPLDYYKGKYLLKKAFGILVNSKGEVLWKKVFQKNKNTCNGDIHKGRCVRMAPNGKNIYFGIERIYYDFQEKKSTCGPAILKVNLFGKEEYIKDVGGFSFLGMLNTFDFAGDNKIIGSYVLRKEEDRSNYFLTLESAMDRNRGDEWEVPEDSKAVIFDTLGKVEKEVPLNVCPPTLLKTSDNKYLFFGTDTYEGTNSTIHLFKFNENLEYDSIYTQPREYDYLCDHPITNSTIYLEDCLVVGLDDTPQQKELRSLNIFPNPISNHFRIQLPEYIQKEHKLKGINITHQKYNYQSNTLLEVVNIKGQKIFEQQLNEGQKEIDINSSLWQDGIYLVRLISGNQVVGRSKVVKK